jgi:hypothetical protein
MLEHKYYGFTNLPPTLMDRLSFSKLLSDLPAGGGQWSAHLTLEPDMPQALISVGGFYSWAETLSRHERPCATSLRGDLWSETK